MKTIGNILWFLLGGLETAIMWCLFGLFWCITIIGIPFGLQSFKFAKLSLWPMGKVIKMDFGKHAIMNILWFILGGFSLALTYLIVGLVWCVTIIGIPFGLQAFKFAKLACFPFGAEVTTPDAIAAAADNAQA